MTSSGPAVAFCTPSRQPGLLQLAKDGLDRAGLERMPGLGEGLPELRDGLQVPAGPQGSQDPLAWGFGRPRQDSNLQPTE